MTEIEFRREHNMTNKHRLFKVLEAGMPVRFYAHFDADVTARLQSKCNGSLALVKVEDAWDTYVIDDNTPEIRRTAMQEIVQMYLDDGFPGARVVVWEMSGFWSDPEVMGEQIHPIFR